MSYSGLLQKLLAINGRGEIENVRKIQRLLGFPDRQFASVHVAGTNGKGSVCIKMAGALQAAGFKTGLYTSPHLDCYRERIRINGEMIPEQEVEKGLTFLFSLLEGENTPATFFEITTLLAFRYFAQEKVDIAVIETGLGGRLDATNVIHPVLSVITSISLDHTEFLGNTIEAIAQEKGGIIKERVPVVIGPHVPLDSIHPIAREKISPCHQVRGYFKTFEEENCAIARAALESLPFQLSQQAIEEGLKKQQPCRFEVIEGAILDVAHNPDGISHLFDAIAHHYPDRPLRLLFGLSKSKDIEGCLKIIQEKLPISILSKQLTVGLPPEKKSSRDCKP